MVTAREVRGVAQGNGSTVALARASMSMLINFVRE
jgi:hypothetical protein